MHDKRCRRTVLLPLGLAMAGALVLPSVDASAAIPVSERAALVAFFHSTGGASWSDSTNWLGAPGTECTWSGVTCAAGETAVIQLWLPGNGLAGTVPADIGDLTSLQMLGLGLNHLGGAIPPELGSLTHLSYLDLTSNQLSGAIPATLGSLTNVWGLYLGGNQLSGAIPPELGALTDLTELDLASNQLSGAIPASLGNLGTLSHLGLDNNQLSGEIPAALGNLTRLGYLGLFHNQLSGAIPTALGDMTNLWHLGLGMNQLSGQIPDQLGNIPNLDTLSLVSNKLSGEIPGTLANLTTLTDIDLRWNALHSSDAGLISFLNARQSGGDWQSTQTIAPTDVNASLAGPTAVSLSWTSIPYTGDSGGYRVLSATTSGGPFALATTTANKAATGATVGSLAPDADYFFVVETLTNPHALNGNAVVSERTAEIPVTTPCPPPSMADVGVSEGDSGTAAVGFAVALPIACSQTATFDYATADDTASAAGGDYVPTSGTLTFVAGVSTQPLTIFVNGDTLDEPNERFRVTFANPAYGVSPRLGGIVTIVDDDGLGGPGSAMPVELSHGSALRRNLAALPGPVQEQHFFLLEQRPYSSYELAVDEVSGDLENLGQHLAVELLAADGTTVLRQAQGASPLGRSRSLRWANSGATAITDQRIRVTSGGCTTECGPEDGYRLRFFETTYAIPRFNNAGNQRTVLALRNPTAETVNGTVYFWAGSGALATSQAFVLGSGETLTVDTTTTPAAGQSGSVTIANDGPYGALVGKAVTLDPGTGFSFDSPMVARPW